MSLLSSRLFFRSTLTLVLPAASFAACGGIVVVDDGSNGNGNGASGGAGGGVVTIPTDPDDCAPLTLCGDQCVDTDTNPQHCGECFVSCGGAPCNGGSCVNEGECLEDIYTLCGDVCTDTDSDPFNCGACNVVCPDDTSCVGGNCLSEGCLCGDLCQILDIGSTVPQSVKVEVDGLADYVQLDCGSSGGGEMTFLFTAPFYGLYNFDTFGSVNTALQILSPTCQVVTCANDNGPGGTAQATVELSGGQTVFVTVDAQASSGTIVLNVFEVTECVSCGEYLTGESAGLDLCEGSSVLYNDLVSCVCEQQCVMQCQNLCSGFEIDQACQDCVLDTVNGCGNQFNECANDI